MCLTPLQMNLGGRLQAVPCRQCRQCRDNRTRDYVGRCIAERQYSVGAHVITLTYGTGLGIEGGGSSVEAYNLTYSDV